VRVARHCHASPHLHTQTVPSSLALRRRRSLWKVSHVMEPDIRTEREQNRQKKVDYSQKIVIKCDTFLLE
jgi:hypothetical protein